MKLPPLLLILLAPAPLAQVPNGGGVALDESHSFDYPAGAEYGGTGDFGPLAVGHLFDALDTCYAVLKQDRVVIGVTPGHSVSFVPVSIGSTPVLANDICTLPGGGENDRDGLLSATANGILLTALDELSGEFVTTTIATGPDWDGAQMVRACDIDGDGDQDAVTVAADGVTVRVLERTAVAAWATGASFTAPHPIRDMEPMNYLPGVTGCEVALLTSWGFRIYELTAPNTLLGSLRTSTNSGHGNGGYSLATVKELDHDVLVSVFENKNGNFQYFLELFGLPGGALFHEAAIPLIGQYEVASIAAGDCTGNGNEDVVLIKKDVAEALVLKNDGTNPFDLAASFTFPLDSANNTSEIGLADFNLDGVLDGVIPGAGPAAGGSVLFNQSLDPVQAPAFEDRRVFPCNLTWICGSNDDVQFDVYFPDLLPLYNGFIVECWQRPTNQPHMDKEQVFNTFAPATASVEDKWRVTADVDLLVTGTTYYIYVRPAHATNARRGPKLILAVSDDIQDLNDEVRHPRSPGWECGPESVIGSGCSVAAQEGITTDWGIGPIKPPPFEVGETRAISQALVTVDVAPVSSVTCPPCDPED